MAEFLQWIGVQFHETFSGNQLIYALIFFRFLYKGIIINHNKNRANLH